MKGFLYRALVLPLIDVANLLLGWAIILTCSAASGGVLFLPFYLWLPAAVVNGEPLYAYAIWPCALAGFLWTTCYLFGGRAVWVWPLPRRGLDATKKGE